MKNGKSTYDFKLIFASALIVILLAAIFFFFWDYSKIIIRTILESRLTNFLLWTVTVLIFLIHYFKHKDKEVKSETILTKKFGVFFDNALGGVTYGTIITTSLTLLKGLYIQEFFTDTQYFLEFKDLDLMTIFGVMIFLLYFSVMKVIDIAKETYKVQHTEQVLTEDKKIVVISDEQDQEKSNNH